MNKNPNELKRFYYQTLSGGDDVKVIECCDIGVDRSQEDKCCFGVALFGEIDAEATAKMKGEGVERKWLGYLAGVKEIWSEDYLPEHIKIASANIGKMTNLPDGRMVLDGDEK